MTEPITPSSPAGAPVRLGSIEAAPPSLPTLRSGDVVSALLAGLPTVFFTTIIAAAIALQFTGSFIERNEAIVTAVFVVIPGVGLAVFVRRWMVTLRQLAHGVGDVRWPFLLVPFFMVTGLACGVAFAMAATHSDNPGDTVVRLQCRELVAARGQPHTSFDDHFAAMAADDARCDAIGRACVKTLLDQGQDTPAFLRQCIGLGFAKPSDH